MLLLPTPLLLGTCCKSFFLVGVTSGSLSLLVPSVFLVIHRTLSAPLQAPKGSCDKLQLLSMGQEGRCSNEIYILCRKTGQAGIWSDTHTGKLYWSWPVLWPWCFLDYLIKKPIQTKLNFNFTIPVTTPVSPAAPSFHQCTKTWQE